MLFIDDHSREAEDAFARFGELRFGAAHQQHRVQLMLEIRNRLTDSRLGYVEFVRSAAEAAFLDHGAKNSNFVPLDLHRLSSRAKSSTSLGSAASRTSLYLDKRA